MTIEIKRKVIMKKMTISHEEDEDKEEEASWYMPPNKDSLIL